MKKLLTILFLLITILSFSQDFRTIDWKTNVQNVQLIGVDTFKFDAQPIDLNDKGSWTREIGNYFIDFVARGFKIIDSDATTITVVDLAGENTAPQTGQIGRVYQSVKDGDSRFVSIGGVDVSVIDELSRWKDVARNNELFARAIDTLGLDIDTLAIRVDSLEINIDSISGNISLPATTLQAFIGLDDSTYITPLTNAEVDRAINVPYFGAEEDLRTDYDIYTNKVYANSLGYDTSYVVTGSEPVGMSYWDSDNNTVSIVLKGGVIGQVFEEAFIPGQNDTGSTLSNGKVATYKEEIGNSGNMRIWLTVASKDEPSLMTLGIITQDIENGNTGKITTRGNARGFQTDGADYGETWVAKDILYKSTTIPGGLTNIEPTAPDPAQAIAVVLAAHPTNGTILVRPTFPTSLTQLSDVNGTALTTTGQFPMWDNDNSYFDFNFNIIDSLELYVPYINALYNVDLGEFNLSADSTFVNRIEIGGDNIVKRTSYVLSGLSATQQSLNLVVDGLNVYMETEDVDGGNIAYVFDEERFILDCTTGAGTGGKAQVQLTVGTVTDEQINYVYVVPTGIGVCELRSSISIPSDTFAWHSIVTIQDAVSVTAHGALGLQRTTEALKHNGRGQLSYMRENQRWRGAKYLGGGASTIVSTSPLDVLVAGAEVLQLHRQQFPSRQVSIDGITVSNASGAGILSPNDILYDLNDIGELADGTTIGNAKYFSYTIWATMASSDQNGNQSKLFANLPTNFYGSASEAIGDVNNYDVRTAPDEYNNIAWLVSRVVQQRLGGSNNLVGDGIYSLTGNPLGSQGGGSGSSALTEFNDVVFHIYNNDDPTKIIDFDASAITTGNTWTIIMADEDVDLADISNIKDSIDIFRPLIDANTGKDTTGIYHDNRTDLDLVSGTNTGDQDISGIATNATNIQLNNDSININEQAIKDTASQIRADFPVYVEVDPIWAADSANVIHWSDTITDIATKSDLSNEIPDFATILEVFTGLDDSTLMNPQTNAEFHRAMSMPMWGAEENLYTDFNISMDTAKVNVIEVNGSELDLSNVAYTNLANTFTQNQTIEASAAQLTLNATTTAAILRFEIGGVSNGGLFSQTSGNLDIYAGTSGDIRFPDLPTKTTETDVVYFNPTTKTISYGSVSGSTTDYISDLSFSGNTITGTGVGSAWNSTMTNIAGTATANVFTLDQEIAKSSAQLTLNGTSGTGTILRFETNGAANGGLYAQAAGRLDIYAGGTSYVQMKNELTLVNKATGVNEVSGNLIFDTDDNTFRGYNGTDWVNFGASGSAPAYGTTQQVPYMNATGTGFIYSNSLKFTGSLLFVSSGILTEQLTATDFLDLREVSTDPTDPISGQSKFWMSDGTGSGDAGDIMVKINNGSTTKTITLIDFSAF